MGLSLIELTGSMRVLDLRADRVLDALGVDDQINTSRSPGVWRACQLLADRVQGWFGERCQGIVCRSRTTPQRSANLAFFARAPFVTTDLGQLGVHDGPVVACVLSDGFTISGWR